MQKNIAQDEMICLAQVGISEILADIKSRINNKDDSLLGGKFYSFFKSSRISEENGTGANSFPKIPVIEYKAEDLEISNELASEQLKRRVSITGTAEFIFDEKIGDNRPSYIGYLKIRSKFVTSGIQKAVVATECREVKYVDLSDPFFDKYALFLKSFCYTLNAPDKTLVVNGLSDDKQSKSFIYLGNRRHPENPDVKNILLDLDFEKDGAFLGGAKGNNGFNSITGKNESAGNFFWTGKKQFRPYFDMFSSLTYYKNIDILNRTLNRYWQTVIDASNSNGEQNKTNVANDGLLSGEANFKSSVLRSFRDDWVYYYGYTDYMHVMKLIEKYPNSAPFRGLTNYFTGLPQNSFKKVGGKMPEFYGLNRDKPIFIEGPVYLRFFKYAFIDQARGAQILTNFRPFCSAFSIDYPSSTGGLEGQDVGFLDRFRFSKILGSHPIDDGPYTPYPISPNLIFYGLNRPKKDPYDGIKGYNIFPNINNSKLVTNYYLSPGDFYYARAKKIGDKVVLDLDGINVVFGDINLDRDRDVTYYRGKGIIVSIAGNCTFGNLKPYNNDGVNNYLKIYLTTGSFAVSPGRRNSVIRASLCALYHAGKNSDDNKKPKYENSFELNQNQYVTIEGNLVLDRLPDLRKRGFTIVHTTDIAEPDYPVRISVGSTKLSLNLDYSGKE